MRLRPGRLITVHDASGGWTDGRLVSTTQDRLTIEARHVRRTFRRPDIRRITADRGKRVDPALAGLTIGAVAGGLVGGLGARTHKGLWATIFAAWWGLKGLIAGAIVSLLPSDNSSSVEVLYEASGLG